jgi:serine/threonine protein kinase
MLEDEACPSCGTKVAGDAPQGLCPACLLAFGLGEDPGGSSTVAVGPGVEDRPVPDRAPGGAESAVAPLLASILPAELANHPDYGIVRELGRGGMGVVYLAHNRLMGRDEVLKVMGQHIVERPWVLDRFMREIRVVARLEHPNIVNAYSAFRCGESVVFAMEYVEGTDLARMLTGKGRLPVTQACYFVHQAALALQHAHEEGMVHRDIKPGNLMLSRSSGQAVIKVLDFGLAKAILEHKVLDRCQAGANPEQDLTGDLTLEGQMLGTPDFIAPEQILDAQKADIRADIYSLGCTLYHLLSGRPPFQATTLYEVLRAHHSMEARLLNFVRDEVPAELAVLVAKMMAKDPDRRFQTPAEVAQALEPFFDRPSPLAKYGTEVSTSLDFRRV